MGKNRIIKILGNVIDNIITHKILIKYTNKPESVHHLSEEVGAYGDNALESIQEYNWNEKDKEKIKQKALKKFRNDMEKYYPDVKFPPEEADKLLKETIEEYEL